MLAPLHDLAYVPPALVALAARKCYAHRLTLVAGAEEEGAAGGAADGEGARARVEGVIAQVLESVETPL